MIYLFIYGNYVCIANCQQLFFFSTQYQKEHIQPFYKKQGFYRMCSTAYIT